LYPNTKLTVDEKAEGELGCRLVALIG